MPVKGLVERLSAGEDVIIAEGYCFEFERRGYLQACHYVPTVVMEHPQLVADLHREFVHAGSDVTQAFTYFINKEKAKYLLDKSIDMETMYMKALNIAKAVSIETGTLLAGDICDTTIFDHRNEEVIKQVEEMFKEQTLWIKSVGVDYVVCETFTHLGEARLALQAVKKYYSADMPVVVTFSCKGADDPGVLHDGVRVEDACRQLEMEGAAVVGLNCALGPDNMLPLLKKIRATCKGPIAAVPVPYRLNEKCRRFQSLRRLSDDAPAMPDDYEEHLVGRTAIAEFTKEAKKIGVQYFGLCCGNMSCYTRKMAEALGRSPPASKYSPDVSTHAYLQASRPSECKKIYHRE